MGKTHVDVKFSKKIIKSKIGNDEITLRRKPSVVFSLTFATFVCVILLRTAHHVGCKTASLMWTGDILKRTVLVYHVSAHIKVCWFWKRSLQCEREQGLCFSSLGTLTSGFVLRFLMSIFTLRDPGACQVLKCGVPVQLFSWGESRYIRLQSGVWGHEKGAVQSCWLQLLDCVGQESSKPTQNMWYFVNIINKNPLCTWT